MFRVHSGLICVSDCGSVVRFLTSGRFSKWRTLKKKNAHVDKQNSSSDDDDDNDDELHFIVLNVIVNVAFFLASLILGKFSRDVVFVLSLSRALFLSCALSRSVSGNSPLMRRFL